MDPVVVAEIAKRYEAGESGPVLAAEYGVTKTTITNNLKRIGVTVQVGGHRKEPEGLDRESLFRLYVLEQRSRDEIAAMFGVSDMLIYARIREWGIPMRSKQLKRAAKWLGADELRRLYCDEKKTAAEIGCRFGASVQTIIRRLGEAGIPVRGTGESRFIKYGNHQEPSPFLVEVIEGEVLGDGSINARSAFAATYTHGTKHEGYVRWLAELFAADGIEGRISTRCATGGYAPGNRAWFFDTRAYPFLLRMYERWYGGGKKEVPDDFILTPLKARHWYIGDGSLHEHGAVSIAAMAFSPKSLRTLLGWLASEQIGARLGANNVVLIPRHEAARFFDYIGPCPESIQGIYGYKWGMKC